MSAANAEDARASRTAKRVTLDPSFPTAGENLKVDLHLILDLDHPAAHADGLDREIGLLKHGMRAVGIAGSLYEETHRLGDPVQRQIAIHFPLGIALLFDP